MYICMETSESKAICTLLTGMIFLLLIQQCVPEAYAHVHHLVYYFTALLVLLRSKNPYLKQWCGSLFFFQSMTTFHAHFALTKLHKAPIIFIFIYFFHFHYTFFGLARACMTAYLCTYIHTLVCLKTHSFLPVFYMINYGAFPMYTLHIHKHNNLMLASECI